MAYEIILINMSSYNFVKRKVRIIKILSTENFNLAEKLRSLIYVLSGITPDIINTS